jgi:hypothetical protein
MKRTVIANAWTNAWMCGLLLMGCGAVQSQSAPPPLEQMQLAHRSSKVSVPVDVRYQLRAAATRDQPVGLDLAFVARVPGQNLKVEFPQAEAVTIDLGSAPLMHQKAEENGVVRRSLIVTPRSEQGEVRVIVSMDVEGGRYFGVFTIPVRTR